MALGPQLASAALQLLSRVELKFSEAAVAVALYDALQAEIRTPDPDAAEPVPPAAPPGTELRRGLRKVFSQPEPLAPPDTAARRAPGHAVGDCA